MPEIQVTAGLTLHNGLVRSSNPAVVVEADQASAKRFESTLDISTAGEIPSFGDVMNPRWARFTNTDPENKVRIGVDVAGSIEPLHELLPGEVSQGPLMPGVTLRFQAIGATVKVDCLVLDA